MEIDKSSLVVSKAGRDQGQLFYVIDADEQYVYLADGKSRRLEKPKRKKRKHIEQIPRTESRIAEKFATARRYSIANYEKNWPASAKNKVKTKGVN